MHAIRCRQGIRTAFAAWPTADVAAGTACSATTLTQPVKANAGDVVQGRSQGCTCSAAGNRHMQPKLDGM